MNKVILIGNLARDAKKILTKDLKEISKFTVAVNGYNNTEFIDCVVTFDSLAKTCNTYLVKGKKVCVEGELRQDKWQESNGATKYSSYVYVKNMEMLSKEERERNDEFNDGGVEGGLKTNSKGQLDFEDTSKKFDEFLNQFNEESTKREDELEEQKEIEEMKYSDVKFGQEELPF